MSNISVENLNAIISSLKNGGFLSTKDLADRYYSVRELYEHRLVLFKILCETYHIFAWKAKKHADGGMHNDSFIAGITTPQGNASYHFKMSRYNEFDIKELEFAPPYDGYTPDEALDRFNSLPIICHNYVKTERDTMAPDVHITIENTDRLSVIINELIKELRAIGIVKSVDIFDGNHTLKELYKQKRELYKLLCHNYVDLAWKSRLDMSGELISEDTFMAGLNTPLGPVCYVLNNEHYNKFNILPLDYAPLNKGEVHLDVIKKLSSIKIRQLRR